MRRFVAAFAGSGLPGMGATLEETYVRQREKR